MAIVTIQTMYTYTVQWVKLEGANFGEFSKNR